MHPQIAAFARLAKENAIAHRKIQGELTRLGRTMHDIAYDPIHDEIVVGSPFAQAILVFRGGAFGEEPPLRIIQGPKTQIVSATNGVDRVAIDHVSDRGGGPIDQGRLGFHCDFLRNVSELEAHIQSDSPGNVGGFGPETGSIGGGGAIQIKATPLMVDDVLFFTAPDHVWAVNAYTGDEIWHYSLRATGGLHIGSSEGKGDTPR